MVDDLKSPHFYRTFKGHAVVCAYQPNEQQGMRHNVLWKIDSHLSITSPIHVPSSVFWNFHQLVPFAHGLDQLIPNKVWNFATLMYHFMQFQFNNFKCVPTVC